jgi:hypothetical protein
MVKNSVGNDNPTAQLKLISTRIDTLADKIQENPDNVTDYNNALEVVVLWLNDIIEKLHSDESEINQ